MHPADTIIIGGGPAGLMTGIHLAGGHNIILEKNSRPGKKLQIAGSGRCNITHTGAIRDFFVHYGLHSSFIKHALQQFTNSDLLNFLSGKGLNTITDKNGKVFPASEDAKDVLKLLTLACEKNNTNLHPNQNVLKIKALKSGFQVATLEGVFLCKNLVIATGGLSYPGTGATGDGYRLAESLGHSLVIQKPALTPVFIKDFRFSELAGVSFVNPLVSIYRDSKKIGEYKGDLGFTHKGLSGPGILDPSRYMQVGDVLKINFADIRITDFSADFLDKTATRGKTSILTFLKNYEIPRSLIKSILQQIGLNPDDNIATVTRPLRIKLAELFCEYPFEIEKTGGYEMAMTTAGGVALGEVSSKTMESKIVKNLYFAGEVLDIDGDTGGYNIQAAFSTGYVAAMSINKSR